MRQFWVNSNWRTGVVGVSERLAGGKRPIRIAEVHAYGSEAHEALRAGIGDHMATVRATERCVQEIEALLRAIGYEVLPGDHKT